jgi:hypothetical protein
METCMQRINRSELIQKQAWQNQSIIFGNLSQDDMAYHALYYLIRMSDNNAPCKSHIL